MKRRHFFRLISLAGGFVAIPARLLAASEIAAVKVRVRADRAWMLGFPGSCAGVRRRGRDDFVV